MIIRSIGILAAATVVSLVASLGGAWSASAASPTTKTVFVSALDSDGIKTVNVNKQEAVTVTATGLAFGGDAFSGPDGIVPCSEVCLAPAQPGYSLVGRLGNGDWQLVGTGPTTLTGTGKLILAFNDNVEGYADNADGFTATIVVSKV